MILVFKKCVSGFTSKDPIYLLKMDPGGFTFANLSGSPNGKNWRGFRRCAKAESDV
jgi:hypothetical protein